MKFHQIEMDIYLLVTKIFNTESNLIGHEYVDGYRSFNVLVSDDSDPIQLIFSPPIESDDCYIMITDGDPEKLASEVAALQEYNECRAHLCDGHTVSTESTYLNDAGWFSYLITSPKVTYKDFPSNHGFEGRNIRFHLALPLTKNERTMKVKKGLEALLNEFEAMNRDTITFNQPHNQ